MEENFVVVEETEHFVVKYDAAVQTIGKEKAEKSSWKPKFSIPTIHFNDIGREFRKSDSSDSSQTPIELDDLNSKATQTIKPKKSKKKKVTNFFKSNWFKVAAIAFAYFISSSYDVSSDGLLAKSFFEGTKYTRHVEFPDRWNSTNGKLIRHIQIRLGCKMFGLGQKVLSHLQAFF